MSVYDLEINQINYDLSAANLNEDQLKIVKDLLPKEIREVISFKVQGVDVSIANAIRRSVISEIEVKKIDYNKWSPSTNQLHIIIDELYDRIQFIPINQDCPEDITFTLSFINNTDEDIVVYSKEILASDGKKYFPDDIRLAILEPTFYLAIEDMYISSGFYYKSNHASNMITGAFTYRCLDFIGVDYLYEKSIVERMVKASDLQILLKKHGIKPGKRPLIIFNKVYENLHELSSNYNFIESKKDFINEHEFLPWYQSTECNPNSFELSFETLGNISPRLMMTKAMDSLITRLEQVAEDFIYCVENNIDGHKSVYILREDDIILIDVLESITIKNIIARHIFILDPTIQYIGAYMEYINDLKFTIIIDHPSYIKLFVDAIHHARDIFINLQNSFAV